MPAVARPYHHGNLRSVLLERAERTLLAGGTGALSLRELAREIGVSHAAPRRHFPDKQALLDALAHEGFERLGTAMRVAVADAGPGFDTRLIAIASAYVHFATERAALLELMYANKQRAGAGGTLRSAAEVAFAAPLELVAAGQASGDVVGGDTDRVTRVMWASFHGVAAMANGGLLGSASLEEVVGDAVERLLLGLRPR